MWVETNLHSFGTIPGPPEQLRLCPTPRHEVQMKTRRMEKQQKPHHPVPVAIW
ncbi:rCG63481 [Rattus norvegicus]|uniref:RCG63481 n=1 Tax=Rattus norvegicus TaxID=10116 RepID=A6HKF2_RAT|nr:rCG63481 [Rattus norvegicus]